MPALKNIPLSSQHVYLIDDDDSVRESLEGMFKFLGYRVRAYSSAVDFLNGTIHAAPAVIVADMCMPEISGVELQSELIARGRHVPIIFISGKTTVSQGILAMKQGAIEFLLKPFERDQLLGAVIRGLELDAKNMKSLLKKGLINEGLKSLSPREQETFELLAQGYSNAQIMDELGISLPTAKQYKSEVMRKLNLRSLSELIKLKNTLST